MAKLKKRSLGIGLVLVFGLLLGGAAIAYRMKPAAVSLNAARDAYAKGDWETARQVARARVESDPKDLAAWLLLARSAARGGRTDSAKAIYRERVPRDRMEAEDYFLVGRELVEAKQIASAKTILEGGLRADPRHPELLAELCRLHAVEDGLKEAVKYAARLAEVPGWEARGAVMLGALHAEMSNAPETAKSLERALRLDPNLKGAVTTPLKARKLYARALLKLGKSEEAEAQLKQVLASGDDLEGHWLLGRALLQQGKIQEANAAQEKSLGYGDESVYAHEPSPFIGSARCASCHQSIYDTQQASLHAGTFFAGSELLKLSWPEKAISDHFAPEVLHQFKRDGEQVKVETKVHDEVFRAVIEYAIGSGDRGMTLVGRDEKNRYLEIRLSKYRDVDDWDVTLGQRRLSPTPSGYLGTPLSADELYGCVNCHTTDGHAALEKLKPLDADHSIGCERCHGPGANHIQALEGKFKELAIERPGSMSADRVVKMCGQCHSPLGNVVLNPEDKTTLRFQAVHFVKSRCYTESNGRLSCTTCHSPHRNAETSARFYESKCLSCHSAAVERGTDPSAAVEEKYAICPINATSDCLKCHMPVDRTAVPHASFSDHYIRVHREIPATAAR